MEKVNAMFVVMALAIIVIINIIQGAVIVNLANAHLMRVPMLVSPQVDVVPMVEERIQRVSLISIEAPRDSRQLPEYLIAILGGVGALASAIVGGLFSWRLFWRGRDIDTRNILLEMIVGEPGYKGHLDSFLKAVNEGNLELIKDNLKHWDGLNLLFVRKPELKVKLKGAVEKGKESTCDDKSEVRRLAKELLSA